MNTLNPLNEQIGIPFGYEITFKNILVTTQNEQNKYFLSINRFIGIDYPQQIAL